ncbi:MAG: carboxymuconolactone decarboxylase family protein [Cyanobacteria bacterium SZAS LIN-2]|nr:carboxymuconolactone decarboxylase family protein [Cyanobacteria bacterium SZAS LIN-3]MBS1995737.1 carboxymuconolactone decarboxylase family protein [Cyanobacteria bacterium SZAS LIN-2]
MPDSNSFVTRELYEFDPEWTELYLKAASNPWKNGILSVKTIELICVGLNAACTNMQEASTRRHIRAALHAGATKEEILMVLKMGSVMSIHSMSLGAPMLLEEAKDARLTPSPKSASTPACDKMRQIGQWNSAWDPFFNLDPLWTDQFMQSGIGIYSAGLMTPKLIELLSIAFDASITHMYAPGTRRHIRAALKAGATIEEVMEVLKVCVSFGMEACSLGAQILAEEQ